jgi:hypothetical protein
LPPHSGPGPYVAAPRDVNRPAEGFACALWRPYVFA